MTTVEYLLNSLNRVAGLESRRKVDSSEWVLCWQVFCNLCHIFGTPTVYSFTSRVSQQVAQHVEWKPDPSSIANVNTMDTGSWLRIYPILSVPSLTKQNTTRPSNTVTLITTCWERKLWYRQVLGMLIRRPLLKLSSTAILVDLKENPHLSLC